MTQEERRKEIIHMLHSDVSLETNKLASMFSVSAVTIRRDFEYFEKLGLVTTTYGGAMVNRTLPDLEEDISRQRIHEKRMIAKAAADLVKPGDKILLDSGSTIKELAIELLSKPDVTVLTNSILAINVLAQSSNNGLLITMPGYFKKTSMCFLGAMTVEFMDFAHVDYAFIGVSGLSHENGGTIPDPDEAYTKRKMSRVAGCTVVLADHWKIGTSSMFTALSTKDIDILITGKSDSDQIPLIREDGVRVIEVDATPPKDGRSNQ
ncbi:MAG: DeoR/GlpR family DNA-binding transcription regulator [Clostridiaceae bacterium]